VTAVVLTLKADPGLPVDMTGVLPAALAGQTEGTAAAMPLRVGNRQVPLGELFGVRAGDEPELVVEGSTRGLDRLGAGMTMGRLDVRGDAGAYLGLGISGGRIALSGGAGDFAGAAMRDGLITVAGDAGALLGAPLPGDPQGMAGGAILVTGSVGDRAGDRMRRGTIAVGGSAGAWLASRFIGGTILLGGACRLWPGYGMHRGTLLLAQAPPEPPATFADNGTHDLPWLTLLERHLADLGWRGPRAGRRVRRLTGDVTAGGKGEILIAA
jgi:formylmethanofuran dehydrogenase subunit C